jgi:hypothetical protein
MDLSCSSASAMTRDKASSSFPFALFGEWPKRREKLLLAAPVLHAR